MCYSRPRVQFWALALLCVVQLAETPWAQAQPQAWLQPCAACHGEDGVGKTATTPHLNGQLASYLTNDIARIAAGLQASSVDQHIPSDWTVEQIEAAAQFYATLPPKRPLPPQNPKRVQRGELLYRERCTLCHTDSGRGSEYDAPLLAAQQPDYLIVEMQRFVDGQRRWVFKMEEAFDGLSAEDRAALAAFFASQPLLESQ